MRTGTTNPQTDSANGFSKVMSILTFGRHRRRALRRSAARAGDARWTETYWGREFMKSL